MDKKKQIEEMYADALFNDESPNVFADRILTLFSVVGQSEQLACPRCGSTNCLLPDKENDAECNDCGCVWIV